MEISRNQLVLFEDGHTESYLEAKWSEKYQAFYSIKTVVDEEGYTQKVRVFSNTIIEKPVRKHAYKKQTDISKMKEIEVAFETAKAYAVFDATNGAVCKCNMKTFYKFYAKSICVVCDGKVYVPVWA